MNLKQYNKLMALPVAFGLAVLPSVGCNRPEEAEAPIGPSRSVVVANEEMPIAIDEKSRISFYTVEHYGEDRNAEEDLKMTIARALSEKKRILLQVGGEWCGWCKLLTGFMEKSEPIRSSLAKNFLLMKVTYTQNQHNEAFLSKYPKIAGYPHLFVLESDGNLLHSQDTSPLEEGKSYNEGKVLSFLDEWKPAN